LPILKNRRGQDVRAIPDLNLNWLLIDLFAATNVLSVVNRKSSERVGRHTDAALPLTEPDTLFFTLFTANRYATTRTFSLSILLLT
jgi:hypothetical protein